MAMIVDGREYITAARAAEELETTITRILMLLRGNALIGRQLDGEWYVASDSIACGKARGREMKTATGCASACSSGGCGCK